MEQNKIYRPKADIKDIFEGMASGNDHMLKLIEHNGGSFTVLTVMKEDNNEYVTSVLMKNGTRFDHEMGDDYFEISDQEFRFFEEVTEEVVSVKSGVISMTLEVNQGNFEEMIHLIEKSFKK